MKIDREKLVEKLSNWNYKMWLLSEAQPIPLYTSMMVDYPDTLYIDFNCFWFDSKDPQRYGPFSYLSLEITAKRT